jgi:hypothetical protein
MGVEDARVRAASDSERECCLRRRGTQSPRFRLERRGHRAKRCSSTVSGAPQQAALAATLRVATSMSQTRVGATRPSTRSAKLATRRAPPATT